MENNSRLVYSTDGGRKKPQPPPKRSPAPIKPPGGPPDDGVVRIARDKKGRGGKTATVVTGLPGAEDDLDVLLKKLKTSLGTGGTREGRALVIQGDQRDRLLKDLTALGHNPKLAGG